MKNIKKFLVGVFAMSALMLSACSGSQEPESQPAASSAAPSETSETTPASSEEETSSEEDTSSEEESSSEESSSSKEQEITEHTVTLDEAPTAGRVVVVHAWDLSGGVADYAAEVSGLNVTFDLLSNDWDGYLIAELKEGKVFGDFSFFDEDDPTKIDHDWSVVNRQTANVTSMTATAASWTTKYLTVEYDATFTTKFGSERTVYINSWINESSEGAGDGASKLDKVTGGKALLLKNADAFEFVVLKAGKTELVLGEQGNWDEVVDAESVKLSTLPTTSVKLYYSAPNVVPVNDGGEMETHEHTVTVNEAPAANHKVFVHGWKGSTNNTVEASVSGAAITFDLGTDDLEGYLIAELKDGATTLVPGQGGNWDEVVLRQTNNVTSMTAATATWKTPVPADTTPYVAVAKGGAYTDMRYYVMAANPENENEVYVTNVSLEANDVIYIRAYVSSTANGWLHFSALKSEGAYANFVTEGKGDNNIKTVIAGSYDFYATSTQVYIGATPAA
ncbi:MAG: hypothetical protein J5618_02370 [Bacilli bacterium]|nr:hypothetical protein [Bacilli bacterium]